MNDLDQLFRGRIKVMSTFDVEYLGKFNVIYFGTNRFLIYDFI